MSVNSNKRLPTSPAEPSDSTKKGLLTGRLTRKRALIKIVPVQTTKITVTIVNCMLRVEEI